METRRRNLQVSTLAGAMLGGVFGALAVLRHGKPLHPHGVVFDAVVRRTGSSGTWGAQWLDTAGQDHGLARLSAAIGVPGPLPDIHGLAITFTGTDGQRHDLLLATTGLAPVARCVLLPTTEPLASCYCSLLPYRAGRRLVLIAAVPAARATPAAAAEYGTGPAGRSREPVVFQLLAAGLVGPWRQFATLELTIPPEGARDDPIRFDPVRHALPGLRWPQPVAQLREPAYASARRAPVSEGGGHAGGGRWRRKHLWHT